MQVVQIAIKNVLKQSCKIQTHAQVQLKDSKCPLLNRTVKNAHPSYDLDSG